MDHSAKFEDVRIPLLEPIRGLDAVSGVLGIPEWWPTGERVAMAIAHAEGSDHEDPLVEYLHRVLTENHILTIRFNFPFAEKSRRAKADPMESLELAYRCALAVLGRDPTATPAHLFLGGFGIGARVAARLASERLQIDGLAMLSYPLHPKNEPENLQVEGLNRVVSPMLFVHGTEDPNCTPPAVQRCLSRIGAPVRAVSIPNAGKNLFAPEDIPPPPPPPEPDDEGLKAMGDDDFVMPRRTEPEGPAEEFALDLVGWVQSILGSEPA